MGEEKYNEAIAAFEAIDGYKDSNSNIQKCLEQIRIGLPVGTISANSNHIVGLKSDGTVIAVGYNKYGQCDVSDWKDIVAVSAGYDHTVGLKSDGTVVAIGDNDEGQCESSDWNDIKTTK